MFSVTHRDPLFCPHSPYFVGYGVQKRRLRLVTINRARPCSFYDLGICWQLSVWKSCWASKQEVDRLITRLGTYWQTAKCLTNEQHYTFYWPARSVQSSPYIYSYPPPHKVRTPPCHAISNAYKSQISSSSESHHFVLKVQSHLARLSVKLTSPTTTMGRLHSPPPPAI